MGNTQNPDTTFYHDGYRAGVNAAQASFNCDEREAALEKELLAIPDFDDSETFSDGFWHGVERQDEMESELTASELS